MELSEYQPLAIRTAKIYPSLEWNLIHAMLGIASEIGELQEVIASAWMSLPYSPVQICEEGGDVSWYVAYLCNTMKWQFQDLFLTPEQLSEHEPMAVAVVSKNIPAMCLVLGGVAGDVGTIIKGHLIYGKPLDEAALKLRVSYLISLTSIIMDAHLIHYENAVLPENIDKLKKRYPDTFTDVAAMERKDKAVIIQSSGAIN